MLYAVMPMDFLDGRVTGDACRVDASQIYYEFGADHLAPGGHGFVEFEALWVKPNTRELFVDTSYAIVHAERFEEYGYLQEDYARIVSFAGKLVADVVHIADNLAPNPVTFCAPTPRMAKKFQGQSMPIVGLIQDPLTLDLFNQLLIDQYGTDAQLAEL